MHSAGGEGWSLAVEERMTMKIYGLFVLFVSFLFGLCAVAFAPARVQQEQELLYMLMVSGGAAVSLWSSLVFVRSQRIFNAAFDASTASSRTFLLGVCVFLSWLVLFFQFGYLGYPMFNALPDAPMWVSVPALVNIVVLTGVLGLVITTKQVLHVPNVSYRDWWRMSLREQQDLGGFCIPQNTLLWGGSRQLYVPFPLTRRFTLRDPEHFPNTFTAVFHIDPAKVDWECWKQQGAVGQTSPVRELYEFVEGFWGEWFDPDSIKYLIAIAVEAEFDNDGAPLLVFENGLFSYLMNNGVSLMEALLRKDVQQQLPEGVTLEQLSLQYAQGDPPIRVKVDASRT